MTRIVLGAAMTVVGGLMCSRGALRLRHSFPAFAALAAAMLGAGLGQIHAHHRFLHGPANIVLALGACGLLGAACFRWYEVAVVITLASIGIALTAATLVVAHADWTWIAGGVGAAIGACLGFFSVISSLHRFVLVGLSALAGATIGIAGLMVLSGSIDVAELAIGHTTHTVASTPGWWVSGLVVAALGAGVQVLKGERRRVTMRDRWVDAGGGQLRAT